MVFIGSVVGYKNTAGEICFIEIQESHTPQIEMNLDRGTRGTVDISLLPANYNDVSNPKDEDYETDRLLTSMDIYHETVLLSVRRYKKISFYILKHGQI